MPIPSIDTMETARIVCGSMAASRAAFRARKRSCQRFHPAAPPALLARAVGVASPRPRSVMREGRHDVGGVKLCFET